MGGSTVEEGWKEGRSGREPCTSSWWVTSFLCHDTVLLSHCSLHTHSSTQSPDAVVRELTPQRQ